MFRLAWRNIWRNSRRSLLVSSGMAFSCAVLVFFIALQFKSYEAAVNSSIGLFHGSFQILNKEYFAKASMRKVIPSASVLSKQLQPLLAGSAMALRAEGFALISSEQRTYGVQVVGVDPQNEPAVSSIPGVVRVGRYLQEGDENTAVLGTVLATNLQVKVGDEVSLLGQGKDGSLAASVFKIKGLFESGSKELDHSLIEINLKTFGELFSMPDQAHRIVVKSSSLRKAQEISAKISDFLAQHSRYKDLQVYSWEKLLVGLKSSIQLDMAFGWLFYVSLVIIVSFSILNMFLMAVLERTREFGIMLALGTKPQRLCALIYLECIMLCACSIFLGALLGSAVVLYFGAYGFSIPGSEEFLKNWNLNSAIYPEVKFSVIALPAALIFLASLLSVTYPALRVLKLKPVEALSA